MRVFALTAHGLCPLQQAEAQVLDWFESEGLELVHGQDGVLIGWSETDPSQQGSIPTVAVEVRFYPLGGGWLQARWNLQSAEEDAARTTAAALLLSLRRHLACRGLWQVDAP